MKSKPTAKSHLEPLSPPEAENDDGKSPDESLTEDGPNGIPGEKANPLLRDLDSLLGPVRG